MVMAQHVTKSLPVGFPYPTLPRLLTTGYRFMGWLQERCQGSGGLLQPRYGIDGRRLSFARKSWFISLGNVTLARYGWVMRSTTSYSSVSTEPSWTVAYLYNKYGAPLDYEVWQSLRSPMGWLSENWQQPDAGMWGARLS